MKDKFINKYICIKQEIEQQKIRGVILRKLTVIISLMIISLFGVQKNVNADSVDKIPILAYHDIRDNYQGNNILCLDTKDFKEGLLYLKAMGYEAISLYDYLDYTNGIKELPKKPVILTFDDGYYSNYSIGFPILKKLNMKANFAIIGWSVGKDAQVIGNSPIIKHFGWEQAKEMEESGLINIESHTYNLHIVGNRKNTSNGVLGLYWEKSNKTNQRILDDDYRMQKDMYNNLGHKSKIFTYPFGSRSNFTDEVYTKLGYEFTIGTETGISDLSTERTNLKRINSTQSPQSFIKEMLRHQGLDETLPFEEVANQDERIALLQQQIGISID